LTAFSKIAERATFADTGIPGIGAVDLRPGAMIAFRRGLKLHNIQQFNAFATRLSQVLIVVLGMALAASAQTGTQKPSLPDPVKFVNKFDIVWNVVRAVFDSMGYATELEDRKAGRITTRPYEFITGSLTSSEVEKVANKKDTITGEWLRARYTAEALLEIVTPTQTMLTIRTHIEGLHRELDGTEKWVPLDSLGTIEKRILGRISMKLLGNEIEFDEKKGFWDKTPQPVPRRPNQ
jgi:hypothetical protein